MDFFAAIELIKEKLRNDSYTDLEAKILEAQLSGGTGGEVVISVCSKLLGLKQHHKTAYAFVQKEADELIAYARSIGLEPRPS